MSELGSHRRHSGLTRYRLPGFPRSLPAPTSTETHATPVAGETARAQSRGGPP